MRFDIITIFPDSLKPYVNESVLKRGQLKKKIDIRLHDLRDYTNDKHKKVDDRPFGGGPGMIMKPQPIYDAVKKIKGRRKVKVILTCPTGKPLTQTYAKKLAKNKNLIIICGRYEGVDERIRKMVVDESISIGDYILTGGELPALVLVDCISRLVPGVLGEEDSLLDESFEEGLLEYPQYTRPADFHGVKVPNVLLSGHHEDVKGWRKEQSLAITKKKRPDLLKD
ncbi:MAG: tRNA (guanosine(37)-N1)-methyltransferase TrmD [Candidatus Omnitrophica bacterium]|nr:tRNA (guanosine(37)-N1)-methyltransferase TrmD [Candidatus Omnitrophota bacterium]MBU1997324.1 tRNA (guanosine(37)-N1)-methyltransferase TrmD [Candidatus Omnitrophota bacterium]